MGSRPDRDEVSAGSSGPGDHVPACRPRAQPGGRRGCACHRLPSSPRRRAEIRRRAMRGWRSSSGPVGSLTDYYLGMARAAATEARRHSDNVVTVYSPDATWPRVKDALDGASIVVYLGHGNGWPSPYSDVPRPRTQNGLGLNPVAGQGDRAHQYFGEQYLERSVRLAPGAVVLLHHLCYASGAAEPGHGPAEPEGRRAARRQLRRGMAGRGRDGRHRRGARCARLVHPRAVPARRDHRVDVAAEPRLPRSRPRVRQRPDVRAPACSSTPIGSRRASTGRSCSGPVRRSPATVSGTASGQRQRGADAAGAPAPAWASPVELELADPVVAGSTAALTLSFAAGGAALPPGAHDRRALGPADRRCRSSGLHRDGGGGAGSPVGRARCNPIRRSRCASRRRHRRRSGVGRARCNPVGVPVAHPRRPVGRARCRPVGLPVGVARWGHCRNPGGLIGRAPG